jgi:hypothetical protein
MFTPAIATFAVSTPKSSLLENENWRRGERGGERMGGGENKIN